MNSRQFSIGYRRDTGLIFFSLEDKPSSRRINEGEKRMHKSIHGKYCLCVPVRLRHAAKALARRVSSRRADGARSGGTHAVPREVDGGGA
jgi:hypothetical protein